MVLYKINTITIGIVMTPIYYSYLPGLLDSLGWISQERQFLQASQVSKALTLEDVVASKLGDVRMLGNEVFQESSQVIALSQCHVGAKQVLVHNAQVEIVAE